MPGESWALASSFQRGSKWTSCAENPPFRPGLPACRINE
jgi:hypothetical protein